MAPAEKFKLAFLEIGHAMYHHRQKCPKCGAVTEDIAFDVNCPIGSQLDSLARQAFRSFVMAERAQHN